MDRNERTELVALDTKEKAGLEHDLRRLSEASAFAGDTKIESAVMRLRAFVHRMESVWRSTFGAAAWKITPPARDAEWLIRFEAGNGKTTRVIVGLDPRRARQFLGELGIAVAQRDRLDSLMNTHKGLTEGSGHSVVGICDCSVAREYRALYEQHHGNPGIYAREETDAAVVA